MPGAEMSTRDSRARPCTNRVAGWPVDGTVHRETLGPRVLPRRRARRGSLHGREPGGGRGGGGGPAPTGPRGGAGCGLALATPAEQQQPASQHPAGERMGVRSGPACAPGLPLLSPPGRAPVAARAVTRLTNKLRRTQARSTFHFVSMTRPECLGVTSARLIERRCGVGWNPGTSCTKDRKGTVRVHAG